MDFRTYLRTGIDAVAAAVGWLVEADKEHHGVSRKERFTTTGSRSAAASNASAGSRSSVVRAAYAAAIRARSSRCPYGSSGGAKTCTRRDLYRRPLMSQDRKSTRLNSSHVALSRMPSS